MSMEQLRKLSKTPVKIWQEFIPGTTKKYWVVSAGGYTMGMGVGVSKDEAVRRGIRMLKIVYGGKK